MLFRHYNTHSKVSLVVILMGQPTFHDKRFARYEFGQFGAFEPNFGPKIGFRPPDRQVNLENRPSKDPQTTAVSEFAKIGRSLPSSTGLLNVITRLRIKLCSLTY